MPTLKEVEFYLKGLWLLFKQDPAGFSYLDLTDRGAIRSFWSILWALPAILISFAWWRLLYLQRLPDGTGIDTVFFFRLALIEACNWLFPLVLLGVLCWMIGIGEKFSSMVVVVNPDDVRAGAVRHRGHPLAFADDHLDCRSLPHREDDRRRPFADGVDHRHGAFGAFDDHRGSAGALSRRLSRLRMRLTH